MGTRPKAKRGMSDETRKIIAQSAEKTIKRVRDHLSTAAVFSDAAVKGRLAHWVAELDSAIMQIIRIGENRE